MRVAGNLLGEVFNVVLCAKVSFVAVQCHLCTDVESIRTSQLSIILYRQLSTSSLVPNLTTWYLIA